MSKGYTEMDGHLILDLTEEQVAVLYVYNLVRTFKVRLQKVRAAEEWTRQHFASTSPDTSLQIVSANAVQHDDYVTIRFRNAISGEHLDSRMRDLGAYSTIARAFDILESKIRVGRYYRSYVQPVPPSTLATTFKELKETPESDGALLIQYVTSPLLLGLQSESWTVGRF
jgi:hypothetical protein